MPVKAYPLPEERISVPRFEEANGFYVTPKQSELMAKIRASNTKPELALRKALWGFGLRYRVHCKDLPGKPDLAFSRWRVAVFVDGDFWHGHNWAEKRQALKKNKDFWVPKIERNMQRDREVNAQLEQLGWQVLRIWEHEIKRDFGAVAVQVLRVVQERAGAQLGGLLFD